MSNIENLLRRQYEGTITPEEQSELDRLTHRDQVIEAATHRAKVLRRRQLAGVTGVASVLIVAGAVFFMRPTVNSSSGGTPIVAKTDVPKVVVTEIEEAGVPSSTMQIEEAPEKAVKEVSVKDESVVKPSVSRQDSSPVVAPKSVQPVQVESVNDVQPTVIPDCEPVVACNTACSPDSVINDIWKFLRT